MRLPLGVADPIFTCELALELGMSIAELGERMPLYELTVIWPQFYAYRQREADRLARKQEGRRRR